MKANRLKIGSEILPLSEVVGLTPGSRIQFRYNFSEGVDVEGNQVFYYEYVNVSKNDRDTIVAAIIRDRYSSDNVEAILRKYANKEDVIDYVIYNNYANLAKAYADSDQESISVCQQKQIIEIVMPLSITLVSEDYQVLSDRMLKAGTHYEADALNDIVKVYVSWLKPIDEQALNSDNRVAINQISLYEEI